MLIQLILKNNRRQIDIQAYKHEKFQKLTDMFTKMLILE